MTQAYQFLIIGLGVTGLSVAQFLYRRGISFAVADHCQQPSQYDALLEFAPDAQIYTGDIKRQYIQQAEQVVVSPGVSVKHLKAIQPDMKKERFISDIELFARYAPHCPVAAITGTNGKSTTTALLTDAAKCAGLNAVAGGNLVGDYPDSMPALDLIDHCNNVELYILELSSFQLETTYSLCPRVSVILNIKPDHLDRYDSFNDYISAKLHIHKNSSAIVVNREDIPISIPANVQYLSFGFDKGLPGHFGIIVKEGLRYIACGDQTLISESDIALPGDIGLLNTMAMFAMGYTLGLSVEAMCKAATKFHGLAHRMQHIGQHSSVDWYDDSKATNVAATCAALRSVDRPVVLIAGGMGKGEDFKPLADMSVPRVRALVLMGKDAEAIATAIAGRIPYTLVKDMQQAVRCAADYAQPGDCVLLSPACASLDMYCDYRERGEVFTAAYRELN
ncbi:MAG: UDP-N-acetylmuramoyl-L-alanine--D-glutamate ligase [Chromatiales bacterium]|nr:UDP-N-acetylmuramoyl-L-alanine--D-glutamate ligase [Chromatiales bacterium]